MTKHRILVVDDEEPLREILQFNLEVEGYEVDTAASAEAALAMNPERYALILLDVMLEGMSGFRMAQQLKARPETAAVPIIFCTARDTEDDTVAGLNIGADDYIVKPFSVREVLARVRSVLRRTAAETAERTTLEFEALKLDCSGKNCFSREEILRRIWSDEVIVLDRTVDVNITRLRRKIGRYGDRIVTRLGYGYGFEA